MTTPKMTEEEKFILARKFTKVPPMPEEIRTDWGKFIIETVLPEGVWSRPGLAVRERSLITVAALCALHYPNELRIHIGRALDNGVTREEVCEVIMHMAVYGGFPAAMEGMTIARQVFDERGPPEKKE